MRKSRFTDSQIVASLKQAENGVPVLEQRQLLEVVRQVRRHGRFDDNPKEGTGGLFDNISGVQEIATRWLWSYDHELPNMALGGITPKQKMAMVD